MLVPGRLRRRCRPRRPRRRRRRNYLLIGAFASRRPRRGRRRRRRRRRRLRLEIVKCLGFLRHPVSHDVPVHLLRLGILGRRRARSPPPRPGEPQRFPGLLPLLGDAGEAGHRDRRERAHRPLRRGVQHDVRGSVSARADPLPDRHRHLRRLGAVLPEVDPEEGVRGGRLLAVPPAGTQRAHLRERVTEHRPALDRLVAQRVLALPPARGPERGEGAALGDAALARLPVRARAGDGLDVLGRRALDGVLVRVRIRGVRERLLAQALHGVQEPGVVQPPAQNRQELIQRLRHAVQAHARRQNLAALRRGELPLSARLQARVAVVLQVQGDHPPRPRLVRGAGSR